MFLLRLSLLPRRTVGPAQALLTCAAMTVGAFQGWTPRGLHCRPILPGSARYSGVRTRAGHRENRTYKAPTGSRSTPAPGHSFLVAPADRSLAQSAHHLRT